MARRAVSSPGRCTTDMYIFGHPLFTLVCFAVLLIVAFSPSVNGV